MRIEVLILLIQLYSVWGAPTTESWVTSAASPSAEEYTKNAIRNVPTIYSMNVDTNVTNRFASSLITSKVKNLDETPQEATFSVVLPDTAFITGFIMEVDGKKYEAYIQEKDKAKKTYDQAVSSGQAAGHVAVSARDSNKFTVSVNIMPQSKATFYLRYDELLSRQKGFYDIVINLHPGQPVKDMNVQVNIKESRTLTSVSTPSLRSGNEISKNEIIDSKATIERIGNNEAKVVFKPDIFRQKEFAKELGTEEENGFAGQFIVQYDVERDPQGGELLFADGYFIHFFAPKDVTPEPKQITFVLDTSGSMWGQRIRQLKEAMKSILEQLNEEDSFNIIDFNSVVSVWNISNANIQHQTGPFYPFLKNVKSSREGQVLPDSFKKSAENIVKAKEIVESLQPSGGTNIESALKTALELHRHHNKDERQPLIMFLTDGDATDGETNTDAILSKITKENSDDIPIISLSFGDGADKELLEKLSIRNHGLSRHIYEGADADLQLKSFYEVISSPLFNNIKFNYVQDNTTELTKTKFPILFNGSELVVAGKYKTPALDPGFSPGSSNGMIPFGDIPYVACYSGKTLKEFKPTPERPIGKLEKHWAYLTLKQTLKERDAADKKEELTKKALDLALKYSFVTPVSSLVVVKPNETKSETDIEDASKGSSSGPAYHRSAYAGGSSAGGISASNALSFSSYNMLSLPSARFPIASSLDYDMQPVPFRGNYFTMPPLSTPYLGPTFDFSERMKGMVAENAVPTTEKITPKRNATIEKLKKELPWFEGLYLAVNGTIRLPQGTFLVGDGDEISPPYAECEKNVSHGAGHCVLLTNCPQIYSDLQVATTYVLHYYCPLQGYAGVCCPTNTTQVVVS